MLEPKNKAAESTEGDGEDSLGALPLDGPIEPHIMGGARGVTLAT